MSRKYFDKLMDGHGCLREKSQIQNWRKAHALNGLGPVLSSFNFSVARVSARKRTATQRFCRLREEKRARLWAR